MKKELCVTCDFYDDMLISDMLLKEKHLEDMTRHAASLGAKRFEWVFTTLWNIFEENSPFDYDVMRVACEAAHANGMRFDVVYKPFESGASKSRYLPHSFPLSDDDRVIATETALLYSVRKFVVENPQCRFARRKGDGEDPGGRLAEIRLVKFDENDLRISPDDISFHYSAVNGNFKKFEGKLETSISKEWKLGYPYDDALSTVISFKGFDLPEDVKYFKVFCEKLSEDGSFSNHIESMVELVNDRGEIIPCAPSTVQVDPEKMYKQAKTALDFGVMDYLNKPEVKKLLENYDVFKKHVEENHAGMVKFDPQWEIFTLDKVGAGMIAVHRGKPMCHPTMLHPVYPEVRKHFLDEVQYCVDRGVDGVNIRISRHGCMNEPWAYGFNDPVIEQLKNKDDAYEAALVNGRAFDAFMEDAAELLHDNGMEIGVHLCGFILRGPDKLMGTTKPSNFVWNWEKWVRDIVDYAEFHKTNFFKFHNVKQILDHFGYVMNEVGKPFIYQSGQSGAVTHFDPPHRFLPFEMEWVRNHPNISCYNLYETAGFFRMNEDGVYEGSPHIRELIRDNWDK